VCVCVFGFTLVFFEVSSSSKLFVLVDVEFQSVNFGVVVFFGLHLSVSNLLSGLVWFQSQFSFLRTLNSIYKYYTTSSFR
jgi:hypothetical protein